jgi:hypothetical protein
MTELLLAHGRLTTTRRMRWSGRLLVGAAVALLLAVVAAPTLLVCGLAFCATTARS